MSGTILPPVSAKDLNLAEVISLGESERISMRSLWRALESQQEFATWAKQQLQDFNENMDFGLFDKIVNKSGRGSRQSNIG